jgi:hypothetical protein
MTNEQKIKAYLAAGHRVKATSIDWGSYTIYEQPEDWWVISYKIGDGELELFEIDDWEDCTIEPLPLPPPPYKVWDKVIILDVAKQVANYSEWDQQKKDMIWKVFTIGDISFCIGIGEYSFPYWAVAPYFDDKEEEEKQTKIQELETRLATIAKEIELLKV